jgi:hypothetical protein
MTIIWVYLTELNDWIPFTYMVDWQEKEGE